MSYLEILFGRASEGNIAVWSKNTKKTAWFPVAELQSAELYMQERALAEDIYFGWGLQPSALGESHRGASKTVSALPGLMMDIDLKSVDGAHTETKLPETLDDVVNFFDEIGFIKPTAIRHSGNGLYYDWLFASPHDLRSTEDNVQAAALLRRMQGAIIALASSRRGWKLDNTSDLARVTRLPGTLNHKTNPPKPVTLLTHDPEQTYSLADIESAVSALEQKVGPVTGARKKEPWPSAKAGKESSAKESDLALALPNSASIRAGCAWMEWCFENASALPEPHWYAAASVLGQCENGEATFHALSRQDPRYDEAETQKKLEHATSDAGPRTCQNIAAALGFDGCRTCILARNLKSPIGLGRESPATAEVMRHHVYDVGTRRYRDVRNGTMLSDRSLSEKFQHVAGERSMHLTLMNSSATCKVDVIDYLPGIEAPVSGDGPGKDVFNLWKPSTLKPESGAPSILLEHLAFLMPDDEEREHFLDYLAYGVQYPAEKIRHAVLMIGKQGTGKSFLVRLLEELFGVHNVRRAESEDLTSTWTERLGNCQVLAIEELDTSERLEVYNRLKTWISEETAKAEEKYLPRHDIRTPRMMFAFSNYAFPTRIQDGDRRWFVTQSDKERREPAYYERLFNEGLDESGRFLNMLQRRDISHFDPSAAPSVTESKRSIIANSRPMLTQELEAMIEEGHWLTTSDLFSLQDMRDEIARRMNNRMPKLSELRAALKALGAQSLEGQVRLAGGDRGRFWVWRNIDYWQAASAKEIREAHLGMKKTPTLKMVS